MRPVLEQRDSQYASLGECRFIASIQIAGWRELSGFGAFTEKSLVRSCSESARAHRQYNSESREAAPDIHSGSGGCAMDEALRNRQAAVWNDSNARGLSFRHMGR